MTSCRPALGTYVEIRVKHHDPDLERLALDEAFAAIALVQGLMSAHAPDSELSQINQRAHLAPVTVHPWTQQVLQQSLDIHQLSGGAFDCCVGHFLSEWGMLPTNGSTTVTRGYMSDIVLEGTTVRAKAPLSLDLSGIAKGFAVDRAADALRQVGIEHATLNAGGDLRVMGDHEEPIYVRDGKNPQQLKLAGTLKDGAFATSGSYFSQRQLTSGQEVSALVNPQSQSSIVCPASYSVIAPTCVIADALTKVLAVTQDPQHPCFDHFGAHAILHSP